jgi:predicted GIY-YIG superfamily endonuclease
MPGQNPRTGGRARADPRRHHSVYVVFLRNPRGDGRAGYYVGMTGLNPEARFANHKAGKQAAGIVKRCGERLVPKLYAHLNPMTYRDAVGMEVKLAEDLRARGFVVYGGH